MDELTKVKEKLLEFFIYIEKLENPNTREVISKFKDMFISDCFIHKENIDTAYYQNKSTSFYINNSSGIVFTVSKGDGDRYGKNVSHRGMDISIASLLSKNKEIRNGIFIFLESEYLKEPLTKRLDDFFDCDFSTKSLKENNDEFVYKTLSDEVKSNKEILLYRYNKLKNKAELENKSLYQDYMISPYGGLDIDVIPIDDLLYEYLKEFDDEEKFITSAMAMFSYDFPKYFEEKIKECSHALYIIKHQKEYEKLSKLKESIYQYEWNQSIDINELNKVKSNNQIKFSELLEEKSNLSNKKYNLLELIRGQKKTDTIKLSNITKSIENINLELKNIEIEISNYNTNEEYYNNLNKEYNELKNTLKKPFENFSINEDFYDMYINNRFGELESLDRLIKQKDWYKSKLTELLENQKRAKESCEIIKDLDKNLEMIGGM